MDLKYLIGKTIVVTYNDTGGVQSLKGKCEQIDEDTGMSEDKRMLRLRQNDRL